MASSIVKWGFVALRTPSKQQFILLERRVGVWRIPQGESQHPAEAIRSYLQTDLRNYAWKCLATHWNTFGEYHCYKTMIRKKREDTFRGKANAPDDLAFFALDRANGLRVCPVTREVIKQLLLEEIVQRRDS